MNEGFTEDPGPREPGIDPLIKLLTSEGTPSELAGEADALAMFRAASAAADAAASVAARTAAANAATDRHARPSVTGRPAGTPPPDPAAPSASGPAGPAGPAGPTVPGGPRPAIVRSLRAWRRPSRLIAATVLAAAAAVVTAAYTADLPGPVQHVAYRALGFAGVPDAPATSGQPGGAGTGGAPSGPGATSRTGGSGSDGGQPGSAGPAPGQAASPSPSGPTAKPTSPAPGRGHGPGGGHSPSPTPTPTPTPSTPPPVPAALTISASAVKIIAGGSVSLTGLLTDAGGNPVPGQDVTLLQHDAGVPGWQPAGQATTDVTGTATVPVASLGTDAGFRFRGPNGTHSGRIRVVVVPAVSLTAAPGGRVGSERLTASAPYAIGSGAILQVRAAGVWRTLRSRPVGPAGQVIFGVKLQRHQRIYRVVVLRTAQHGKGISNPVIVPARA
jgi:hypothetical protein